MHILNLSIVIHEEERTVAVKDPRSSFSKRSGAQPAVQTPPRRFHAIHLNFSLIEKRVEQAYRVGTAANARDQGIWQPSLSLHHLVSRFLADDALEIPHHHGVWMGTGHRTDANLGADASRRAKRVR